MRSLPIMALVLALAANAATIPMATARGGGGMGGGGMGGGAMGGGAGHGGMPATANVGSQATGTANTGNSTNGTQSAMPSTTASSSNTRNGRIAAALGALNASHASATAARHASSTSRVGRIAAYDQAMTTALAMPDRTPTEVAARNAAIANARATLLAPAANKPLSAPVVATVDNRLGLPASDPNLGVAQ